MDFDHDNVRRVGDEDRLSSLPDEIIHKILSYIDTKFAVQTSSLSWRWKLLWTSMPYLKFDSWKFQSLPKFSKFVSHVLSRRNHQTEVSTVDLDFSGAASQVFVRKIANYAFARNVQELTIRAFPKNHYVFPLCLFHSQSLEQLTLSTHYLAPCITPKTPWDFPALTTLHLSEITLCDETTNKSIDLFSKCVNLKNLTLKRFFVNGVKVFDINLPKLANLTLIDGMRCLRVVNLIAPQLENLTIDSCPIDYMNAPPGLSSLFYGGYCPLQLSTNGFHSLDKVTIDLRSYKPDEHVARKTINMLQEIHSAKYLTLSINIVECLSSFPDLLSHHPSPFDNLKCLKIESSQRSDAYKITMSTQVRNFLLENCPSATFLMETTEAPPTKAMKQKEARAKRKAKQEAEMEGIIELLQVLVDRGELAAEKAKMKAEFEVSIAQLAVLLNHIKMQGETERALMDTHKAALGKLLTHFKLCVVGIRIQSLRENVDLNTILLKQARFKMLLDKLPKRQRAAMEARLVETEACCGLIKAEIAASEAILEAARTLLSDYVPILADVLPGQPSSSGIIPTSSDVNSIK